MNTAELHFLCFADQKKSLEFLKQAASKGGQSVLEADTLHDAQQWIAKKGPHIVLVLAVEPSAAPSLAALRQAGGNGCKDIPFLVLSETPSSPVPAVEGCTCIAMPESVDVLAAQVRAVSDARASLLQEKFIVESIFISEARNILEELEPLIMQLEAEPENADTINTIFRLVHTVKGSSGFLDTDFLYRFAHRFEDLLSELKAGKKQATPEIVTTLLSGLDTLRAMVGAIASKDGTEFDVDALVAIFSNDRPVRAPANDDGIIWSDDIVAAPDAPSARSGQGGLADRENRPLTAPKSMPAGGAKPADAKSASERDVLRVTAQTLDEFMELSGEITVIRNMVNKLVRSIEKEAPANKDVGLLGELLEEMHKINTRMQGRIVEMRKVPLKSVFRPLPRTIRDLNAALRKQIELVVEGDDLRVDAAISQVLSDSLIHIIRNSADHGVETPAERTQAGKPAQGTVRIRGYETREEVIIEISDDGRGIDPARIGAKAVEKGLVTPDALAALGEARILSLIFEPGFSTAAQITDVSGRGVGMDMVRTSVEKLKGRIDIQSTVGQGTQFKLSLPIPKSVIIISSLLIHSHGQTFALPQDNVVHLLRLPPERRDAVSYLEGTAVLERHGELLPLVDLSQTLRLRPEETHSEHVHARWRSAAELAVIVLRTQSHVFGLVVDEIIDGEEIVVKSVGPHLNGLQVYAGATFLGDGGVCTILDVAGLAARAGIKGREAPAALATAQRALHSTRMPESDVKAPVDFLMFELDAPGLFCVPLNDVHRVEEIPTETIQSVNGQKAIIYNGQAMPLYALEDAIGLERVAIDSGTAEACGDTRPVCFVLTIREGELHAGFIIKAIADVAQAVDVPDERYARAPGVRGTLLIEGRATTSLDLGALLRQGQDPGNAGAEGTPGIIPFPRPNPISRSA